MIFVHRDKSMETFAATDPLVADLDRLQFESGEGPGLEIIADRLGVLIEDTATESRWPAWSRAVAAVGVRAMLGTRVHTGSTTIGSLNLYDPQPGRFTEEDRDVAHVLARHAAVAAAREQAQLGQAIDARQLVGQATGIVMERFGVDAERAFDVLRRYSQQHNLKLRDVATRLIETRRLPD